MSRTPLKGRDRFAAALANLVLRIFASQEYRDVIAALIDSGLKDALRQRREGERGS